MLETQPFFLFSKFSKQEVQRLGVCKYLEVLWPRPLLFYEGEPVRFDPNTTGKLKEKQNLKWLLSGQYNKTKEDYFKLAHAKPLVLEQINFNMSTGDDVRNSS